MFALRANASEGSFARDADKEKLLRLRQRLEREGYLEPRGADARTASPAPASRAVTVDVLAAIAGKELPMPRRIGEHHAEPAIQLIKVHPPVKAKALKALATLPGQTQVMADVYHQHLGKRNWLQALIDTVEPKLKAASTVPSRPLSKMEALRLERSAAAAAAAGRSFIVGTVFCVTGAPHAVADAQV